MPPLLLVTTYSLSPRSSFGSCSVCLSSSPRQSLILWVLLHLQFTLSPPPEPAPLPAVSTAPVTVAALAPVAAAVPATVTAMTDRLVPTTGAVRPELASGSLTWGSQVATGPPTLGSPVATGPPA